MFFPFRQKYKYPVSKNPKLLLARHLTIFPVDPYGLDPASLQKLFMFFSGAIISTYQDCFLLFAPFDYLRILEAPLTQVNNNIHKVIPNQ